jgi:hypothetical protein
MSESPAATRPLDLPWWSSVEENVNRLHEKATVHNRLPFSFRGAPPHHSLAAWLGGETKQEARWVEMDAVVARVYERPRMTR